MQIEENKIYEVKKEFLSLLQIPEYQWKKRKEDLLDWWMQFFDYELIDDVKPMIIRINEVYNQDYQPLPKKSQYTTAEKQADYTAATITILSESGKEYRPITKTYVARRATNSFGYIKYNHKSDKSVAQRYVKPAFDKFAENNGEKVWCWSTDCIPLTEAELEGWKEILRKVHLTEEEIKKVGIKALQKESIEKELTAFEIALDEARQILSKDRGVPVYMDCWRVNEEGQKESAAAKVKAEELEKEYQVTAILTPITKRKEK